MKKLLSLVMLFIALILSGCGVQNEGFFHQTFVEPFIFLIKYFAEFFGNSYGIGLIMVTLCVRVLMMPLMFYSFKSQRKVQYKTKKLKPEIDALNKRMREAETPEERQQMTQELMKLYSEHGISPVNKGCLPILIQMPILTALYFAISHNDELASQTFMWFSLGTPNILMALIAAGMYYLQMKLSNQYMPEEMQPQMKIMTLISPLMILMPSLTLPAAMPLYWAAGAIVMMVQQYLSNKYFDYYEEV
ncbi:membrane protein insertase YidC [Macrococcus brunensis]|uniref:membrane protein insertase YidC n=1 Tax=Macrococcus brunensis TaxID=198483 RepID=UPI001EF0A5C4|nr:membrane protein insertase YidC [Macrococcus brunensis]ULG74463.1 membrane protein insertase YidC [Macrococcus brunensis]